MRNRKIHIVLLFLSLRSLLAFAQDPLMLTQTIVRQEFMNPAYSSFKDYTSINLMNSYQWLGSTGTPETYAANVYLPVSLSGFGIGFTAITQTSGNRKKAAFTGSFSHNIRVGYSDYLALGYGFGVQNISYKSGLETNPDFNLDGVDLNVTDMSVSMGMFFYDPAFFVGVSSNVLFNKNSFSNGWLVPGFDFTSGLMYRINSSVLLRPDMVLKYYPTKMYLNRNDAKEESIVAPILDLGINVLLGSRLWLGTSHRLGRAQTFSVDVVVRESFRFGYTFEYGLGLGVNKNSSHGIRVAWNMIPKRALRGFERSGRYNLKSMMSTNLYR